MRYGTQIWDTILPIHGYLPADRRLVDFYILVLFFYIVRNVRTDDKIIKLLLHKLHKLLECEDPRLNWVIRSQSKSPITLETNILMMKRKQRHVRTWCYWLSWPKSSSLSQLRTVTVIINSTYLMSGWLVFTKQVCTIRLNSINLVDQCLSVTQQSHPQCRNTRFIKQWRWH